MNKTGLLYGSLILSIINFLARILGFIYKIILSKLIGAEGIGLFQMMFPLLMFFLTFTTSGIPIAVSRLVAKHSSLKREHESYLYLKTSIYLNLLISTLVAVIIIFLGDYITSNILKNETLTQCIYLLIPAIIIISISSAIRGYFYGIRKISSAGIAQIIEQITRITFVIGIIYYLQPVTPQFGATIALLGVSVGEFFGLLWLIYQTKGTVKTKNTIFKEKPRYINFLPQISNIAIPITLSRMINVLLQLINTVIIPQRLIVAGYSKNEALAIFGKVTGMAMPLIFFPFIFTSALAVNIIPNLSGDMELKNYNLIKNKVILSIKVTLLVSLPVTAIFLFFAKSISLFVYDDVEVGIYIKMLGYSTVFLSLQHTLSGILHGLDKQVNATINYVIGMTGQLFTTYFLVANPSFGINGFFISFILATIIITTLNFTVVCKTIKIKINIYDVLIKPLLFTVLTMVLFLTIYNYLKLSGTQNITNIIIPSVIAVSLYLILAITTLGFPLFKRKK